MSEKLYGVGVMTPIDDETTWIFARFFQTYVKLPVLGKFLSWLLVRSDWLLTQKMQDFPTFASQEPAVPEVNSGYRLFHADQAIVLYLKHRQKLKQAARAKRK